MLQFLAPITVWPLHSRIASICRCLRHRRLCRVRYCCALSKTPSLIEPSVPRESLYEAIRRAPSQPGVYRFHDNRGSILYVGKARLLSSRLRQYVTRNSRSVSGISPATNLPSRMRAMVTDARSVDFIVTDSEAAALALEAALVRELRPPYNVLLKDDRRHPYALVTFSESYPRVLVTRSRNRLRQKDRLYGPFVDERRLRNALAALHAALPLRQRQRPLFSDRPCINYDLGRCPGVCQQLIPSVEYAKTVSKVDKLLSGRVAEVLDEMRTEMREHSAKLQYEQAGDVRDRIAILERAFLRPLQEESLTVDADAVASIVDIDPFVSRDVFALACDVETAKVVLFQVRAGCVVARLVFTVAISVDNSPRDQLLSAALTAHYSAAVHPMEVPEEVILCEPAADVDLLRSVLIEKRGKKVSVRLVGPRTKAVAKIVQKNANLEVQLELQRVQDTTRALHALEDMLSPFRERLLGYYNFDPENAQHCVDDASFSLRRIECFDISHTSGSNAVGSMVAFINGLPVPSEYRRYNLSESSSSSGHPDDFESIRETLSRRFRSFDETNFASVEFPDLVVIDGGKGQLSAASQALKELKIRNNVALMSIAKKEEALFIENFVEPINFDEKSGFCSMTDAVRLVCRIRDEAHRTAIIAHRSRRGKHALRSGLGSVPGLGASKRQALLEHFNGSAEAIAQASAEELQKANGIGPALARRVVNHFQKESESGSLRSES